MPFSTLHTSLQRALSQRGYSEPTAVQRAILGADVGQNDLLVSAQTGSGKTIAYGMALASTLLGPHEHFSKASRPLALIIAPTRELAMQVQSELTWLYSQTHAQIAASIGGMDIRREMRALEAGCHIVVGTPGRLRDHLEHGRLDVSDLRAIVLDEADEMLNLGFREDMEFILDATPPQRRTLLFSATIPRDIATIARRYQKDALRLDMVDHGQQHSDIDYRAVLVAPNEIELAVVNLLRFYESTSTIIFCKTREAVRHLQTSLTERGFLTVALSGEYSQNERTHALHSLRSGQARVCVATDVAARGIDLPGLDLVIHAELPNDRDTLLHRSGRTGRAGRKGMSIVLVPFNRRRKAEMLLERARIEAQWGTPPAPEDIRHADLERMKNDPIFTSAATPEEDDFISHIMSAHQPHDIASAFVRLYRTRLPAAEDLCIMPLNAKAGKGEQRPREIGTNDKGRRERFERRDSHFDKGHSQTPMQWFRMNVGRQSNADPKWIIPLICRLGHITKKDIGLIKIFDHETKFEIAQSIAGAFNAHIRRADDKEAMNIKPIGAEGHTNASTAHPHKHKHKGLKGADHKDKTQRKDKASPAHKDKQRHKNKTKAKHGGKTQTGGHETAPNTKAPNTKAPNPKAPKTKKHKARD